jgi:hypothetical protein
MKIGLFLPHLDPEDTKKYIKNGSDPEKESLDSL